MPEGEFDRKRGIVPEAVVRSAIVEIQAPSAVVWEVLTDLEQYGEWNPFCVRCVSTLQMGAPVHMNLVEYTSPGRLNHNVEYICAFEPEKMLSWEMPWTEQWPYPARRDQIIETLGEHHCRYYSTDAFLGENGIHVMRFVGAWVERAFNDTANALKVRAEARFAELQRRTTR
jgi:hypothetical protein